VLRLRHNRAVDALAAARRWAETWERAWPAHDIEAIESLYTAGASYRSLAFEAPTTVERYLPGTFANETEVECRFGEPVAANDRAAVEWWASWLEAGAPITLAGVTVLRFDGDGLVLDQRDYWNDVDRREPPYDDWLS
jgi:SnoaL-like domain